MGRRTIVGARRANLRRAGLMALAMGVLAGAQTARADCKVANFGTLPVEMINGRATTMVKINGQDTRFILDTGAFFNTMSRANADALGLRLEMAPPGFSVSGIGGSVGIEITHVKDFGFLNATLHNIEFVVGGTDVGMGLLGANLLDVVDLDIDLAQGKATLMRPTGCSKLSMAYWAPGGNVNTAPLLPSSGPLDRNSRVTVMVNGKPVRAELDTGATTLITRRAAERVGIDLKDASVKPGGTTGGIGTRHMASWIARVPLYQIGTESIQNSRMQVLDGNLGEGSDPVEMLLGVDFFLSHHIFVANSQRRLYFSYNGGRVSVHDKLSELSSASTVQQGTASLGPKGEGDSQAAVGLRGQAHLMRGEAAAAIVDLDKAIAMAPDAPAGADLYYARARARMTPEMAGEQQGGRIPGAQVIAAIGDLDTALRLAPGRVDVLTMRARLLMIHRERARAEADIATLRALVPAGSAQVGPLAEMLIEIDQPAQALPLLDGWMRLHPEDGSAGNMLNKRCWARALANTMLEEAAQDCRRAIKREGPNPGILDSQALVELRLGHWQAALDIYTQALAKAPNMGWPRYGQALAKLHLGQSDPKMAEAGKAELAAVTAADPRIVERARRFGLTPP